MRLSPTNLECSSAGDPRFSALNAEVVILGYKATIEEHYQLVKRFPPTYAVDPAPDLPVVALDSPATWRQAKKWQHQGRHPCRLYLNRLKYSRLPRSLEYEAALLPAWYAILWLKWLDEHPGLRAHLATFKTFSDRYARPGGQSQAHCISLYILQGRDALRAVAAPLLDALKGELA